MNLFFSAITKFLLGVILVGMLIFLPAGTILYFNGWLLMRILFVPMFFLGIVMTSCHQSSLCPAYNNYRYYQKEKAF